ncbi:MAG TPA: zinc-ribbon domain-containing protein [Gemmatimonadales bacterium]|nr:zinc-ribbon domain-containing protein [Gemmatimonadales bacterium]
MNCSACGTSLAPTARFCHKCGARVNAPAAPAGASDWKAGIPWLVAGAAAGALVTLVALRVFGGQAAAPAEPPSAVAPFAGGGGGVAPDISQMSPEERATRLYNRVMTLHAEGKPDSAEFFLPMAIQAYGMLPALDADARYHLGVLDMTAGDLAGALAQADTIQRLVPTHLFAPMLRARVLDLQQNTRGAVKAYRDFLKHETAERAKQRPEYAEHAQNLDAFHQQALTATSAKPPAAPKN